MFVKLRPWHGFLGIILAMGIALIILNKWRPGDGEPRLHSSKENASIPAKAESNSIYLLGELEAAQSLEIISPLGSYNGNREIPLRIASLVGDGDFVEKGDLICQLDSSPLERDLVEKNIQLEEDRLAWIKAEQDKIYLVGSLSGELAGAQMATDLFQTNLEYYDNAIYPLKIMEFQKKLQVARTSYLFWSEVVNLGKELLHKKDIDRGFFQTLRSYQLEADAYLNLANAEFERFTMYRNVLTREQMKSKLEEARQNSQRITIQGKARIAKAKSEERLKKTIYDQRLAARNDLIAKIQKCRLEAPRRGMVLHANPANGRRNSGLSQGMAVTRGQVLFLMPDLRTMQVKVFLPETQLPRVKIGDPADVRISMHPGKKFKGKIHSLSTIPDLAYYEATGLKAFATLVILDPTEELLQPRGGAEVIIHPEILENEGKVQ